MIFEITSVPIISSVTYLSVAVVFLVLWRSYKQPKFLVFSSSFACSAALLMIHSIGGELPLLQLRTFLSDGLFIAAAALLLVGVLLHCERNVPWRLISGAAIILFLAVCVIDSTAGITGVKFVPFLGGIAYLGTSLVFLIRRDQLGGLILAILASIRGTVHLPWLWMDDFEKLLVIDADAVILNALGLVLVVTALMREKENAEKANAALRHQTERLSNLNTQLEHETRAANSANRAKSEFLSNMSHELRTPLNAVIGFSEMISLKVPGEDVEKYVDYGRDIEVSARHLLGIIEDVLDMSRVEISRLDLQKTNVPIRDEIGSVVGMIVQITRLKKLSVRVVIDDSISEIFADKLRLNQVLLNLLMNAAKYSNQRGEIEVHVTQSDNWFETSIKDNGVGIKEEDIPRVFDPFFFSGAANNRSYGGVGLGLSITKRLVELHGGEISLQSKVGEGTTVMFRLPKP